MGAVRQRLAAPLGEAAGDTGSALAVYPEPLASVARRYGETIVAGHVLLQEANAMERFEARTALLCAAHDLCLQATHEAQAIAMATGSGGPFEMAELIAASIEARTTERNHESGEPRP